MPRNLKRRTAGAASDPEEGEDEANPHLLRSGRCSANRQREINHVTRASWTSPRATLSCWIMNCATCPAPRLEAFIAAAQPRAELWRLVLGLGLVTLIWAVALIGLPFVGAALDRPAALKLLILAYLGSFAAMILGLALALRLLHGRGLASVLGPDGLQARGYVAGVAVVAGLSALAGLPLLLILPPVPNLPPAEWLRWLPLALPAVAVQTAAEELVFRGYLMQQLAVRFRRPAVWLGVPAVLFGLLHWNPAEFGGNAWLVVLAATATGLLLGDITARLGNLSVAMGLHFANNVVALLLVAMPSPFAGLSLYLTPVASGDGQAMRGLLLADIASTLVAFALWRVCWRRRARLHSAGVDSI